MRDPLPIEAQHLRLRRPREDDLQALVAARNDDDVLRWLDWAPLCSADAQSLIEEQAERAFGTPGLWQLLVIASTDDDRMLGELSLLPSHEPGEPARLAISLLPEARGQGLATDALHALMDALGGEAGFDVFQFVVDARNQPVLRLAERFGAVRTAETPALAGGEASTEVTLLLSLT
ncbi:MAG: GNAT family N-acetyltransferase [Pseudomonadales bacterium]|nr:GNAT family N-acetyltransferase [Pseudomonadales bacterium]